MQASLTLMKQVVFTLGLVLVTWFVAPISRGQSLDISAPAPVRTDQVVGTIAARDLGDSRLTDHFYAFTGVPGDVLITVQGKNLNGDVDVFTAGNLRPLLKFTLYAESSSPITKSIYLRKRQDLVLRVEARTPSDDEGIYEIRFGGSFEPIAGEALIAGTETPVEESAAARVTTRRKNGRRVSSVGARINEPPPPPEEVAATPTPEPTPSDVPVATATPERTVEAEKPAPTPRRRGRAPSGRRRSPSPPAREAEEEKAVSNTETEVVAAPVAPEPEAKPATTARRKGRRGATPSAAPSPVEPEPQTGPRLIIEMQDGTRVERFMSTIRRVTVENNQIVVVGKEGKTERIRMAEVVRMAIEP
ncbi:MAG: hypothetical protein ACR2G5_16905 [Pyrinomonadaceae bacterium]